MDVLTQVECTFAIFLMPNNPNKPVMFKDLNVIWRRYPQHNASTTLLIDDSHYKVAINPYATCICPQTFRPADFSQNPMCLTNVVLPWLTEWNYIPYAVKFTRENPMLNPYDHSTIPVLEQVIRDKEGNR